MNLLVKPDGTILCIYSEELNFMELGCTTIVRASMVEPDAHGQWYAELRHPEYPWTKLGPYKKRSEAIAAEVQWLTERLEAACKKSFSDN